MTTEERIAYRIGNLTIQVAALESQIESLRERIVELEKMVADKVVIEADKQMRMRSTNGAGTSGVIGENHG